MIVRTHTIPSLLGTFGIPAKLAHSPKMPKEPSSPSRSNAQRERQCLIGQIDDKIEQGQRTTRGHKTLGARWLFALRLSNQSSLYLDSEVAPKPPTFHTAIRWRQAKHKRTKIYIHLNKMRLTIL
jgi:hypothetical protein